MIESTFATCGAAFGLSLTYSLMPGASTIEALRRGARRGVRAVVAVRLGSMVGSLAWALAGLTGAGMALQNPHCRLLLSVAGSAFLLLLAWRALRPGRATAGTIDGAGAWQSDALAGALMAVSNPLGGIFWLGVSGSLLGNSSVAPRIATVGAFVTGFIAASLLFTTVFAAVVGWGLGVIGGRFGRFGRAGRLLCVAPLAWFALRPLLGAI